MVHKTSTDVPEIKNALSGTMVHKKAREEKRRRERQLLENLGG
jgi:hypothetical protein